MLDGRSIIEVRAKASSVHDWRVWLVNDHQSGRVVHQAVRLPHNGQWFIVTPFDTATQPELRDVRRYLFRGNGRLTGGHPEITDPVSGPMSRVNVYALCSTRTVPGGEGR